MDKIDYEKINEEQERQFERCQVSCRGIELRDMRKKIDELVDWINEYKKRGKMSEMLNCCKAMIDQRINEHEQGNDYQTGDNRSY